MTLPALMLQKPHAKSKACDHVSCLQRQLALWKKGGIAELLQEGRAIQRSLNGSLSSRRNVKDVKDDATTARKFDQLTMEGRVRAALQLLTKEARSGLLSLDKVISDGSGQTIRDILEDKHPNPEPVHADAILDENATNTDFHSILFESRSHPKFCPSY